MALQGKSLQYYVFFAGSVVALLCGFHLGWPSPSLPQLLNSNSSLSLSNDEGSWVASIFLIGGTAGAIVSGLVLDVVGRRITLLLAAAPLLGTWLLVAFAQRTWMLYLARFLGGVSDGLVFCCMPLFLAEISDSKMRGFFISSLTVVYLLGTLLVNLLGYFLSISEVAFLCAGLSILAVVLCVFVPESPYFLIIKGDVKKAQEAMIKFTGGGDVDGSLPAIRKELENNRGKWIEIFTDSSNRKSLCLVIILRTIQQCSGFMGIMFYAQTLFEEAEEDVSPVVFVSVYYVLQMAAAVVNASIVDRVGRRPLLIGSMTMVIMALAIITSFFTLEDMAEIDVSDYSWLPICGFFIFIVGYTVALHSISILFVGEIFPLNVKSCAIGILDIYYGLTGVVVSKFFQYTKDEFGMHVPFIVFTLCSLVGLPYVIFCVPETKRKTLEEIQNQLRAKGKSGAT